MRQARVRRGRGRRRAVFAVAPFGVVAILAVIPVGARQWRAPGPVPDTPLQQKPRIVYLENAPAPRPLPPHATYLGLERGDTLAGIFAAAGVGSSEAASLATEFGRWADLRRLRPGELVRVGHSADGAVQQIELHVTGWGDVEARRDSSGAFQVRGIPHELRVTERIVTTEIATSLYEAIEAAGEGPQLVSQLADIFQWDVDLFRLKKGDWVSLIVDRRYVGEDQVGYNPIRAAKFHFQGSTFEAFRFERPDGTAGYYTRTGTPVRKQFLKAPLKFTRITSGFSHRRFHPVLRRFRSHYGVDYGAPIGTPVLSTADGVVVSAGYSSGEGKYIRIRHNSRIETSYLHLSRFAKDIRRGKKVQQGDVIGYVGMSGLTTGPHLDYRVTDRGQPLNPLQLKSITPDPLHGASLRHFKATVTECLPKLAGEQLAARGETLSPALF